MALLEARGLVKGFPRGEGRVEVLRGCDLALAPGETVAITGPSGAGKSTLLNLLCGLDAPDAGELRFDGEPLTGLSPAGWSAWRRRHAGFVFQFHFLLPDFTALENLLLPVRLAGPPTAADTARARDLLARLGLADRADHLPGELSGGEQQRVAVARALVTRPDLVFADEPFGNLDRERADQLADLLFSLARDAGSGLLLVTHDPRLAARADRRLALADGRLAAV